LLDCKLIAKHQFGKTQAQYEKSFGYKQHDHLICIDCHQVREFCDPRLQNTQQMVEEVYNCKILHHSLMLYGHCKIPNCTNKLNIN
jgi:Fur family ferric uptake transcriptional regulator